MRQRRSREIERALGRKRPGLERRNRSRGVAEAHHQAARAEAIQRSLECFLAHRVVDHRQSLALGDPAHPVGEVLLGIDDRMVAAMVAGQFRFLPAADGADDGRAQMLGPLAKDQPDPAGGGVDQDGISFLDPVGLAQEVADSHTLEHHRRRGLVRDAGRNLHHPVGRDQAFLRIGAKRRGRIGHPVADLEVGHIAAQRLDDARPLHAESERQRQLVEAGPVIDIDIVEPDGGVADAHLALPGAADFDLPPLHRRSGARLVDLDGVGHRSVSPILDGS